MGRKLNLSHLTEAECGHILDVVNKDFNLRHSEKERLRRIEEDVEEEENKYAVLSKSRIFNEKNCICCFSRFLILFNPRILCYYCKFKVCKKCIELDKETKKRCCKACFKSRQLKKQSNEWFYSSFEKRFKRCGSAKVIRSLYKRHLLGDDDTRSLIFMSHSDSGSAVVTRRCHSMGEAEARHYGDTWPKFDTMTTSTKCDCGRFPCQLHPMSNTLEMRCRRRGSDSEEEEEEEEEEEVCEQDHQHHNRGQRLIEEKNRAKGKDSSSKELLWSPGMSQKSTKSAATDVEEEETRWNSSSIGLPRADSSIQTERESKSEAGTMTMEDDLLSKGLSGFDGMATVSTEGHETDPRFITRPHNIRVLEGEPFVVDCQVEGTEPIDVLWFCNRNQVQQLEESDRCEIRRHGNMFSLTVFEIRPSDSLEYMCIAVNGLGQCAQGFTVTVDGNAHARKSPEFTSQTESIEIVPEGSEAILHCSVSGYPEPKISWYKNNQKLVHGGRYRTDKHFPGALNYRLVINDVKADDSGTYSVTAKNIAGRAQHSIQLLIQPNYLPEMLEDQMVSSPSSVSSLVISSENELLRLAEGVSRTQGRYTTTAARMLRSADVMSSMQSQLDEMDKALEDLEGEVLNVISDEDEDEDSANNNCHTLDDLADMKLSAQAVGMVTSAALELLSSAKELAMETLKSNDDKELKPEPKQEEKDEEDEEEEEEVDDDDNDDDDNEDEDEEEGGDCVDAEDLDLSYTELEKLYMAGLISSSQLKKRLVRKRNIKRIRRFLQSTMTGTLNFLSDPAHPMAGDQSQDSAMETSVDSLEAEAVSLRRKKKTLSEEKMYARAST